MKSVAYFVLLPVDTLIEAIKLKLKFLKHR